MLILVISWYYAGKIITITGKLCRTGVVKMITKEKSEAISYKLPPGVFREETAWMDFLRNRVFMNKSFMTNAIAAVVFGISYEIPGFFGRNAIMLASLFALSGALTNWLAVYMLFERIPGLYGSGIVTLRFDQFKQSIRSLIMENFFTKENFVKVTQNTLPHTIQPEMVLDKIDFDDVFSGLVAVIKNSSFGGIFILFGGEKAIIPLREPFKKEFERKTAEILRNIDVASILQKETDFETFRSKIGAMVDTTVNELTPQRVKEIVEEMMRAHLGWLVVWGGVFGALIGFVSAVFF
ncbi:hypothetical protein B188_25680 [Candidatus Brocadiaceae bacterium B188]|nr:hypothetical protein B188_25680 [Candidatus Brocadiaceae bacterium B188]